MSIRKLFTAGTLLMSLTLANVGFAATQPARTACALTQHRVTSIRPHYAARQIGRTTWKEIRGAELYVPAEPGLTAQWLQREVEQHVSMMHGSAAMPGCPLNTPVRV